MSGSGRPKTQFPAVKAGSSESVSAVEKTTKQTITKQNYTMKNKIAIASAFIAASSFSFAEIALTENLSVEGFIDASYNDSDALDASFALNEVEVSFLLDMGAVSARIDTQYTNRNQDGDFFVGELDQAYISYDVFGGTMSVGGIDSQLGYEAFEAPGLYTNSFGASSQLPGTDFAVKFTMDLDEASSLGVALIDDGSFIGDEALNSDTVIEVAYGRDLGNGFGAFVGFRSAANGDDLMNAYVTYETGAMTFAAEIVDGETEADLLLLANYAYSDNASVTVRYTTEEGAGNDDDVDVLTLAHQLALADNLSLTTELTDNGADDNEYVFSVGALFTF